MVGINTVNGQSAPQQSWVKRTIDRTGDRLTQVTSSQVSSTSGKSLTVSDALRNTGIGAAAGAALGGVSLLAKVGIPFLGKAVGLGGIAKFAGIGGAVGLGIAALPVIAPAIKDNPIASAAVKGAGIGAAAGFFLPLISVPFGAIVGAGVGAAMQFMKDRRPENEFTEYPGFKAYPGFTPVGRFPNGTVPAGLTPVSPWSTGFATPHNQMTGPFGFLPEDDDEHGLPYRTPTTLPMTPQVSTSRSTSNASGNTPSTSTSNQPAAPSAASSAANEAALANLRMSAAAMPGAEVPELTGLS